MKKERKLIIAGNWKMNKTVAEALDLVRDLKTELATIKEVDIVVFPPFTALSEVAKVVHGSNIHLGAQNMSEHNIGAHTGEIAAGDAQGIIGALRDSRPLGAASVPKGIRRVNFQESASCACRVYPTDYLCR